MRGGRGWVCEKPRSGFVGTVADWWVSFANPHYDIDPAAGEKDGLLRRCAPRNDRVFGFAALASGVSRGDNMIGLRRLR